LLLGRKSLFPDSLKFSLPLKLESGDTLIVSDIRQIGRSASEIITTVNTLIKYGVRFVAIKEDIELNRDNQDLESQGMVKMLELFDEIERERMSQRTTEALVVPKARGRSGGRPRTDPKKLEQARILYGNSQKTAAEICNAVGVGRRTFFRYLKRKREQIAAMTDDDQA